MSTTIEWTQRPGTTGETWNPVVGCTKVSAGCKHCYAKTVHDKRHKAFLAGKLQNIPQYAQPFEKVQLMHERLTLPLKWKKPRTVFVNSMSDLFHEDVPFDFIDQVFAVMAQTPQHTYQILTKRPERMAEYFLARNVNPKIPSVAFKRYVSQYGGEPTDVFISDKTFPLPNLWLGTSIENQATADERIPHLLRCPAAVRFLSCEPLLGHIELDNLLYDKVCVIDCLTGLHGFPKPHAPLPKGTGPVHWVIAGGESGPGARPMHPDWARSLRDQCKAAGVPFFFKQWGQWLPSFEAGERAHDTANYRKSFGERWAANATSMRFPDGQGMVKVGKSNAGHLLDGEEHYEWPKLSMPMREKETR